MTSTAVERPWAITELTPDTRARTLTDEIVEVFQTLFVNDMENARALSESTDNEDSVEGSVTIDRVLLAAAVKKMATAAQPQVMAATVKKIASHMNRATKRVGIDRVAIAARKAEFLAIQGSEEFVEESEPSMNERHDNGSTESE